MTEFSSNIQRTLAVSSDVREICLPLEQYGIEHFSFMRLFQDGSKLQFCSDGDWFEHYFRNHYNKVARCEGMADVFKDGYTLWSSSLIGSDPDAVVIQDAREVSGIDHGIIVTKRYKKYTEFCFFMGAKDHPEILNFYVNNLDILEGFIAYFKDKAEKYLSEPGGFIDTVDETIWSDLNVRERAAMQSSNKREFLSDFTEYNYDSNRHLYLKFDDTEIVLTRREKECLYLLLNGKTADEIGVVMHVSRRTVEKHISNIKTKFGCRSLVELIVKIFKKNRFMI